jgi:hypothetical protein
MGRFTPARKSITIRIGVWVGCTDNLVNEDKFYFVFVTNFVLRSAHINPLTPELNPSAQRCLKRLFTRDFAS